MDKKGFTLIELILVIAILGILAVSALPKFLNLSQSAEDAARDGVVGAVRSGIALYRANDMVANGGAGNYPASLDAMTGSYPLACITCYDTILSTPLNTTKWEKTAANAYRHIPSNVSFTYNATNGTFQ